MGVTPPPLRRYYNSAGNFNRIPPVLAKPKPPPFNKGGFQQKCADDILRAIFKQTFLTVVLPALVYPAGL